MNRKRFAIKFADLKDQTTYNQINKVFSYLVDFPVKEFENPWFTSAKAYLIYNRTLTIVESTLSDEEKRVSLKYAVEDLLSNEDDIKSIKWILTINEEWKSTEIIKYISKEDCLNEIEVLLEKYLPISFFDKTNETNENGQNDKFKNFIIDSYKKTNYEGIINLLI